VDLKRLAASIMIAGQHRNFTAAENRSAVLGTVASYRNAMTTFASQTNLDVWYAKLDIDQAVAQLGKQVKPITRKRTEASLAKARTHDSMQAFSKLTTEVDGKRRITATPRSSCPLPSCCRREGTRGDGGDPRPPSALPLLARSRTARTCLSSSAWSTWPGSRRCRQRRHQGWIVLMLGRDDEDPLFPRPKRPKRRCSSASSGHPPTRTTATACGGQRLMQASSDIFLGWERADGIDGQERDFYFRQLRDWKGSADLDNMIPSGMTDVRDPVWLDPRQSACPLGRPGADRAYLGKGDVFDQAIADFSVTYAEQNARDYAALQSRRRRPVVAETGV